MNKVSSSSRGIQSVEVGCKILQVLVDAGEPMMLRDLAARTELAAAQAHAYLVSFRRTHLVEQDPASGTYSIGPFSMQLAQSRMSNVEPLAASIRASVALSEELGLMAAVVICGAGALTVVHVQEGAHTLNVNLRAGTILPTTGSASGYVFAAFGDAESVKRRIRDELEGTSPDVGPAPDIDEAAYRAIVEGVRAGGYGCSHDLPVPGICTIAAPVYGPDGRLEVALTLVGPSHVVNASPDSPVVARLLACSRVLSAGAEWAGG